MKINKKYLILLFAVLVLIGCTKYDNFSDRAKIKQAERNLSNVKNNLERYYLDNITFPPDGADLKQYIGEFFTTTDTAGNTVDKWNTDVVNAFHNKKIHYETPDSLKTYYIWVQANDKSHTMLSEGTKSFKDPIKTKELRDKDKIALEEAIRKNKLKAEKAARRKRK
ncbi:type II secretion system protein GspG [candidate division WOR-3 bacterium]|jgi:Tfp pilus assembly protein PilE|nr:type II secretion system protein GspG [candidate division WOR-3 bacterium]